MNEQEQEAVAKLLIECQRIRHDAAVVMDNPTLDNKAMCSRTIKRLRERHIAVERLLTNVIS